MERCLGNAWGAGGTGVLLFFITFSARPSEDPTQALIRFQREVSELQQTERAPPYLPPPPGTKK